MEGWEGRLVDRSTSWILQFAVCFSTLKNFLEMSFPGWFLLHKGLCFSPWQPHNSGAHLSSDSTNRTPQNTHFCVRVFPSSSSFPAKTLAQMWDFFFLKTEWSQWLWMKTHAGIHQCTCVSWYSRYAQGNLRSLRCMMVPGLWPGYSRTGSSWVNPREPRLKQQQVQKKNTGRGIT